MSVVSYIFRPLSLVGYELEGPHVVSQFKLIFLSFVSYIGSRLPHLDPLNCFYRSCSLDVSC